MQQKFPLESIPEMKLFVDMEKQKGNDHIPLVGSYVMFSKNIAMQETTL